MTTSAIEALRADREALLDISDSLTGAEWKEREIREAKKDIAYHTKELAAEIERSASDVDFIAQLRAAVKPGAPKTP